MTEEVEPSWWQDYKQKRDAWFSDNVGLHPGMLATLKDEDDDWTFIIKAHAILEVALNHMLMGRMNHPELSDIIPRFNIHGRTGKIACAQAFGVLSKPHARFIQLVTAIRKTLVHDIKHFDFTLYDHVKGLNNSELSQWKSVLLEANFPLNAPSHFEEVAVIVPRFVIFEGCMSVMGASFDATPDYAANLYRWRLMQMQKESETPDESSPTE